MLLKQLMEIYELLDRADANGKIVKEYLETHGAKEVVVKKLFGDKGHTDFIRIRIPGTNGKSNKMDAPTIGIIGRLGGVGARPTSIGMVSDGDGALVTLTIALKILEMQKRGDYLEGDVIACTQICPNAPTEPHDPVTFMCCPVEISVLTSEEVDNNMDAILSVGASKGTNIINARGIAISPTVKDGYILKVSDDILNILQITSGRMPQVFALSTLDITPSGNGLYHLNSILQPSTLTSAPVVGVGITTEVAVPGSATGVSHFDDLESAARFMLEVAKAYGRRQCKFYDKEEFNKILKKYGPMNHLQTLGK